MAEEKRVFTERRRGPDAVVKAVWWIVGIGWLLIVAAIMIAGEAQPEFETFIDRMLDVSLRTYVDRNLLRNAFYILLINLVACMVGFILNMLRQRRKTDKISKSILVLGGITLIGIIWYLIKYGL